MQKVLQSAVILFLTVSFTALAAKSGLADWTAYAVDGRGHFGHGRAHTRAQAEDYALGYCAHDRCHVVMTSRARCVALATSNYDGFWVGTGGADSSREAAWLARRYCSDNAAALDLLRQSHLVPIAADGGPLGDRRRRPFTQPLACRPRPPGRWESGRNRWRRSPSEPAR